MSWLDDNLKLAKGLAEVVVTFSAVVVDEYCKGSMPLVREPAAGGVVWCRLPGGLEHSGIWLGDGRIAHMTAEGEIEPAYPHEFIWNPALADIYVACWG